MGIIMTNLITVPEAAATLGVSSKTVRRWIAAGRLPAYRVGPVALRVDPSDLATIMRPVSTAAQY